MSWECNECHVNATGRPCLSFMRSHGRCETCGRQADCTDCHCQGDWGKAYRLAKVPKLTPEQIEAIWQAWTVEGPAPRLHAQAKVKLAKGWPALSKALTEAFG